MTNPNPVPQRITPSCQPVFPCWLYAAHAKKWVASLRPPYRDIGSIYQVKCWPYFLPDSPTAPTCVPGEQYNLPPDCTHQPGAINPDARVKSTPSPVPAEVRGDWADAVRKLGKHLANWSGEFSRESYWEKVAETCIAFESHHASQPAPVQREGLRECHCGSEMGKGVCLDGASVICKELVRHEPPDAVIVRDIVFSTLTEVERLEEASTQLFHGSEAEPSASQMVLASLRGMLEHRLAPVHPAAKGEGEQLRNALEAVRLSLPEALPSHVVKDCLEVIDLALATPPSTTEGKK